MIVGRVDGRGLRRGERSRSIPPGGVGVVLRPGLDPSRAARSVFLLPERGAALQVVHQVVAGLERGAAMARSRRHEDDGLAGRYPADPMDDQLVVEAEALAGGHGDAADLGLGEARIRLELQRDGLALLSAITWT